MNPNQVYIRGNALDYDRWEREGAKGEKKKNLNKLGLKD